MKQALILLTVLSLSPVTPLHAASEAPAAESNKVPPSVVASDWNARRFADAFQECEKRVAEMAGKPCDIIFIGDSITQKWKDEGKEVWVKRYAPRNALNFGLGGDSTQHVLWRLETMNIESFEPKVAVVLVGTNNQKSEPPEIAAGVRAVIAKTKQLYRGVKVIAVSILPNARATDNMAATNKIIRTFADNKTVFYLDLAAKMTSEGDSWRGLRGDKLHLQPEGYELWANELDPLLENLLANGKK